MALFAASFLVLFLETAIIRWMPAYVRLLAYFSNFILLATFLGIGLGCLITARRNLTAWFPLALVATIAVVESTLLLPILFVAVAALFVTIAYRMGRLLTAHPPLRAYVINLLGSLAG